MQINVSQLLKESIGSSRKYKIDETIDIAEDKLGCTVSGEARSERTPSLISTGLASSSSVISGRWSGSRST